MMHPTKLIKKKRKTSFEANFNIPENEATCFHNNRKRQLMQMLQV